VEISFLEWSVLQMKCSKVVVADAALGEVDALCVFNLHSYFWSRGSECFEEVCEGKNNVGVLTYDQP
jgi:hypothetical protein